PVGSRPTSRPSCSSSSVSGSSSWTRLRPEAAGDAVTEPTAATLQAVWSRSPRQLTHGLAGDPTLQPEALAQVAQSLPAERIECHLADLALVHPTGAVRRTRQQADEVLRDLANQTAWVMLVLQSDAEG